MPREGAATQTRQRTWKNFTPTHKNNSKQLQRRVHSVSLAFSLALLKIFEISHSLATELHILHHNIPPTPASFKLTVLSQKPYANFLLLPFPHTLRLEILRIFSPSPISSSSRRREMFSVKIKCCFVMHEYLFEKPSFCLTWQIILLLVRSFHFPHAAAACR